MNPFLLINLAGILVGATALLFVLEKRATVVTPSSFLSLMVLLLAVIYTQYMTYAVYGISLADHLVFVGAPIFYMYVHARLTGTMPRRVVLHFIPAFLFSAYSVAHSMGAVSWLPDRMLANVIIVLAVGYGLATYHVMHRLKAIQLPDPDSFAATVLVTSGVLLAILVFLLIRHPGYATDIVLSYYVGLAICMTSYAAVNESIGILREGSFKKYSRSPLTPEQKKTLVDRVTRTMEQDKFFLQNSASLPELAKRVGTSPNHLSQVINECMGKSFLELLSAYRVLEAQRLLRESVMSTEEIAEAVGYNSKSAFFSAFKKSTGKTPAEFREIRPASV